MTSFSSCGMPILEQSPLKMLSQPGKSEFTWVKFRCTLFSGTPRRLLK